MTVSTYTEREGSEIVEYPTFSVEYRDASHRYWIHRDGERTDAVSVTSVLKVLAAPALVTWAQRVGAEGALKLAREGELDNVPVEDVVDRLRLFKLDTDSKRDEGGDRGTSIHTALQDYARDGTVPNVGDFRVPERPYVQALCRWLLRADPTPILVEQIVGSPTHGFAGRVDLVAEINGLHYLCDAKTNRNGRVYDNHHAQAAGYVLALEECGYSVMGSILVGLGDDGTFEEVPGELGPDDFLNVLRTHRTMARLRNSRAARERAAKAAP